MSTNALSKTQLTHEVEGQSLIPPTTFRLSGRREYTLGAHSHTCVLFNTHMAVILSGGWISGGFLHRHVVRVVCFVVSEQRRA
jgi:hypothetical protein